MNQEEYFHPASEELKQNRKHKRQNKKPECINTAQEEITKKHNKIPYMELAIILLLIVIYAITLRDAPGKKINETSENELVQITGTITSCSHAKTESLTIINLTDETGSINTVMFYNAKCYNGMNATIKGRTSNYEGSKELTGVELK